MKKLKLDLDALAVDSFDPAPVDPAAGTVLAGQVGPTAWVSCGVATCFTCAPTCRLTCAVTCRVTCGQSCVVTCQQTCFRTCWDQASCGLSCQLTCGATCVTCGYTCDPQLCGRPSAFAICP